MMAGLFEYEQQKNDLQDRYGQQRATDDYARFISQQRYTRQRDDMNRGFQRNFPKFTAQGAQRLGSGIRSGVFNESLGRNVQDFNRQLGDVDQDQAQAQSRFANQGVMRDSAFQRALLLLQEQLDQGRAMQDPYAGYESVYS